MSSASRAFGITYCCPPSITITRSFSRLSWSNKSWVLAAQVPGLPRTKAQRTIEPNKNALLAAIDGYRARAAAAGYTVDRVTATYEAGWSGFWLARWLVAQGVEVHVVQPSSVPVDRRLRRAKSDGIGAELLLRTLLAWLRGGPRVCSMVPIPDEADEDARGVSANGPSCSPIVSASRTEDRRRSGDASITGL